MWTAQLHTHVLQDGMALSDVVLPPWANGSPDEFVRVMREALESDVVSQVGVCVDVHVGWGGVGECCVGG